MSALSPDRRELLLSLARRIVPGVAELDDASRAEFLALIEGFVDGRPAALRAQLFLFLSVLRWLPALLHGARFERLPPEAQDAFLRRVQDAPSALVRKGFWGVKALVFMGYYGRPAAGPSIGYRPSRTGNDLLRKP